MAGVTNSPPAGASLQGYKFPKATGRVPGSYPRTVLPYPGGKVKAVPLLLPYIPDRVTKLASPFAGGLSMELALTARGVHVRAYDIFEPLVNFWREVIDDPNKIALLVDALLPLDKSEFFKLRDNYDDLICPDNSYSMNQYKAAVFWMITKCSFSGVGFAGGFSQLKCGELNTRRSQHLSKFYSWNLAVKLLDFHESIPLNSDRFLYCDPPYMIDSYLYGKKGNTHKGFDHEGLCELLKSRDDWLLSYNNCESIRARYKGFRIKQVKWTYTIRNIEGAGELLIFANNL